VIGPDVVISAAGTDAVSCVALTNVAVRLSAPKLTVDPLTKFVPLTVSVNAAPPAVPLGGLIEATVGTGFTV